MDPNEHRGESRHAPSFLASNEPDLHSVNSVLSPQQQQVHRDIQGSHFNQNQTISMARPGNAGLIVGGQQVEQPGAYLLQQFNSFRNQLGGRYATATGGVQFGCIPPGPTTTDQKLDQLQKSIAVLISMWQKDMVEIKQRIQGVEQRVENYRGDVMERFEQLEDRLASVFGEYGSENPLSMSGETADDHFEIEEQQSNFAEQGDFTDNVSGVESNGFGNQISTSSAPAIFAPFLDEEADNVSNVWTESAENVGVNPIQSEVSNEAQHETLEIHDVRGGVNLHGDLDTEQTQQNALDGCTNSGTGREKQIFFGYGNLVLSSKTASRAQKPASARMQQQQATSPVAGTSSSILPGPLNVSRRRAPRIPIKRERVVHYAATLPRSETHSCICGKQYRSRRALFSHVKVQGTVEPRWKCTHSDCSERFIYPYFVKRHLENFHKEFLQCWGRCGKCYKIFPEKKGMRRHVNERGEVCRRAPKRTSVRPSAQNGAASATANTEPYITLN